MIFLLLSSCTALKLVGNVTAGEQKRTQLLNERLTKFNRALYWGSINEAMLYVKSENRSDFYRKVKKQKKEEQLVDYDISDVFLEENDKALVEVAVRYYKVPHYIVKTREERQVWEFYPLNGGWLYQGEEDVKTN